MNPEEEIVQLRKEVRFLTVTMTRVLLVLLGLIALMNVWLALRCGTFQEIYNEMLGKGAPLPRLTKMVLDGGIFIAGGTVLLTLVVVALTSLLKARWPRVLLVVTIVVFVAVQLLMVYAFLRPIMVTIVSL
jgi:hypothetical protein